MEYYLEPWEQFFFWLPLKRIVLEHPTSTGPYNCISIRFAIRLRWKILSRARNRAIQHFSSLWWCGASRKLWPLCIWQVEGCFSQLPHWRFFFSLENFSLGVAWHWFKFPRRSGGVFLALLFWDQMSATQNAVIESGTQSRTQTVVVAVRPKCSTDHWASPSMVANALVRNGMLGPTRNNRAVAHDKLHFTFSRVDPWLINLTSSTRCSRQFRNNLEKRHTLSHLRRTH